MAYLKVARMGHPVLIQLAEAYSKTELLAAPTQRWIDDMIETMFEERGVGLAAPQVFVSKRLFVMSPSGGNEDDTLVVVNPALSFPEEKTQTLWEGCLSIPGIRGKTSRRLVVDAEFLDRRGKRKLERFEGLAAAIVQHETDHLDGRFFFDRVPDLRDLAFEDEYSRHVRDDEDEEPAEDGEE